MSRDGLEKEVKRRTSGSRASPSQTARRRSEGRFMASQKTWMRQCCQWLCGELPSHPHSTILHLFESDIESRLIVRGSTPSACAYFHFTALHCTSLAAKKRRPRSDWESEFAKIPARERERATPWIVGRSAREQGNRGQVALNTSWTAPLWLEMHHDQALEPSQAASVAEQRARDCMSCPEVAARSTRGWGAEPGGCGFRDA